MNASLLSLDDLNLQCREVEARPVLSRTRSAVANEQLGVPEVGTRRDPGSAPACRQFQHHELPVPAGRTTALTGTDALSFPILGIHGTSPLVPLRDRPGAVRPGMEAGRRHTVA